MKVQIHANYDNETHKFTLQIGYGNQSFKWLGMSNIFTFIIYQKFSCY